MSETTPPPASALPPHQPMNESDARLWATLIHVGGIFFSVIPALIGYLMLKDRDPFVRDHAATALNFQLTVLIVATVATITFVGVLLLPVVLIVDVIFSIIAALEANRGNSYVYPLTIRFIQ